MTRRIVLHAFASIAALVILSSFGTAAEPFHGFFRPRGGELYSPLHYWSPGLYKVKYYCHGPECRGCGVSVHPPARPADPPVIVAPVPGNPLVVPAKP
jgi:hypothetical protein